MANLSVKDVPEHLAERLRQRAARNHRSLQGELMAIIEQAAYETGAAAAPALPVAISVEGSDVAPGRRPVTRRGSKSIEQIAAEHRVRFPQPIGSGPNAVDIIRADRDAR
ncbi:Arc family DNA-binding protein [Variovorax sp. J22P240]|uniref:FitA-like ribbon-helix-helix domain-containing protein n=1 Tax=unclassified Variovorax TaxID=663243 RepID=UPI002576E7ED|nr:MULTISPECIES: Arc family DNA-binding protein [unclassified Variovorax]MDM0002492.1 Arc family DNA-binding protein [Variovorax sp. J22P240]MDM0053299.1 Arc family DNA-binding protein [Variovorax sp. J22R115]